MLCGVTHAIIKTKNDNWKRVKIAKGNKSDKTEKRKKGKRKKKVCYTKQQGVLPF